MNKSAVSRFNGWAVCSTIIAAMIVLPNLSVLHHLFDAPTQVWFHIRQHLLRDYVVTTVRLTLSVLAVSTLIAVPLAWFVTVYDFPGKGLLSFGLALPLAIPPYIAAYTYSGMLGYTGFVQTFLRDTLGVRPDPRFFDILSEGGAVFVFSLFLYPYTYMIVRSFLMRQSAQLVEAGRVLGAGMGGIFFRVVLPLSRHAILSGATLVALETISDYGVVSYFGVPVFSTAIFKSWISFSDVPTALRLSALLLVSVLLVTSAEKHFRSLPVGPASARLRPLRPIRAEGPLKYAILLLAYGVFALGVLLPVGQIVVWTVRSWRTVRYDNFWSMAINSAGLALGCSAVIVVLALIVANYNRLFRNRLSRACSRLAIVGYSIPGTVVAITLLLFFLDLDRRLSLRLGRTLAMVTAGYVIRYMAIAYQNIESGFEKIGLRFVESARTLGYGRLACLLRVDLPMMKDALIGAFILTFVDIVKELPLVLFLRPFNFHTLSTKVFEYAHDEMIPESSPASLAIVLLSCVPMLVLHRLRERGRGGEP